MHKLSLILVLFILTTQAGAQISWHLDFTPGIVYVPPMPLKVSQKGFAPVSFWADYETAPLKLPFYYSVRLGFDKFGRGWETELNHLKIYLKNNSDEIQRFSVSHGYNQLLINRVMNKGLYGIKAGIGCVIAHPENTVRNLALDEKKGFLHTGYYVSGAVLQYGIFKSFSLTPRFYLLLETSATLAYAVVPVSEGHAHVPVFAIHLKVGPGYIFIK